MISIIKNINKSYRKQVKESNIPVVDKYTWTTALRWIVLIVLSVIWGSSFFLIKHGLEYYNDYQVAAFRMFFAFLGFIPFILKFYKKINKKNLVYLLEAGFIGNLIPGWFFAFGQQHVNSSLAGMLNAIIPLLVLFIGFSIFRNTVSKRNILGVLVGLVGTIGLVYNPDNQVDFNWYTMLIVLAVFFYAFNMNIIRHRIPDLSGIEIAALSFLFIGPVAGCYLFFAELPSLIDAPDVQAGLFYLFLLGFLSSFVAVSLFNSLIKNTSTMFASLSTYIIPIVAMLIGFFDGEIIHLNQMVFIAVIFCGIFLSK